MQLIKCVVFCCTERLVNIKRNHVFKMYWTEDTHKRSGEINEKKNKSMLMYATLNMPGMGNTLSAGLCLISL